MNKKDKIKDKIASLSKISVEKDIKNKEREIENKEYNINNIKAEMVDIQKEKVIFANISEIMLKRYEKHDEKKEYKWEFNPTFWKYSREKQIIDNNRRFRKYDDDLRNYGEMLRKYEEQLEDLKESLKIQKKELEEEDTKNDK